MRLERGPAKSCARRLTKVDWWQLFVCFEKLCQECRHDPSGNSIKSIRSVKGHVVKQKVTFPRGRKRKKKSAIVPTCLIEFFNTSADSR